jgi:glycosyltransferase involved in cell wall biosynthesis
MSSPAGLPSAESAGPAPDGRATGGARAFSPALLMDVELAAPLPAVTFDGRHGRVFLTARLHTEPLGTCTLAVGPEGLAASDLAARLWPVFRAPAEQRFAAAGLPQPGPLTAAGLDTGGATWPFLRQRREVLVTAPRISVVLCTRDRPDQLGSCLRFLSRQEYPDFEVLVVDNAPGTDEARDVAEAWRDGMSLRYLLEPRPGLSWARNAGTAAAAGEIVAFLDDDEEPDRHWLAGLAAGFGRARDVGCVTGMVLPARLETPAQQWFEDLGGHCKGRDFRPDIFSRRGPQSPLFPLPCFGVGANMAFRREVLEEIGGFDVALGAGTPTLASEDTLALTMVLLAGHRIAYEPAALMRHDHRADMDGLARQLEGYGVGLTVYYSALLRHRPGVLPALLRLLPAAFGYLRSRGQQSDPEYLPPELLRRQRRGMLAGPARYVRSLRVQARVARSTVRPS